jgi:hypothetical protein
MEIENGPIDENEVRGNRRFDGGLQETQPEETTISALPNGPLHAPGKIRITGLAIR